MKTVLFSFLGIGALVLGAYAFSQAIQVSTEECKICNEIIADEQGAIDCQTLCATCKKETKSAPVFANCVCGKLEVSMGANFSQVYKSSGDCVTYYTNAYQER